MVAERKSGFVYILTNPAYANLVKIGHTARDPNTRAAELSAGTGVPARFVVAWSHPVKDHEALEGIVHGRLARCRANDNREFFRCEVSYARKIIEREAAALLLPWWQAWLHRLVHPLPSRQSTARSGRLRRRRSHDSVSRLLFLPAVAAMTYVLTFKPGWVPPGLLHLLWRLPHFSGPQTVWP